jgi:hypothetical protein
MKLTRFSTNYVGRSKSTVFAVWDSFRDMLEYNKRRMTMCSQYTTSLVKQFYDRNDVALRAARKEWFGTTDVNDALEDVWTFINTEPLNLSLENFNNMTVNITTVGFSQKKKLNLNDLYRGVFSFDLAAPYLYHKRIFYSPLFGQEVALQKVVSEGIEPNLKFYYADEPKHELDRKGVFDSDGNKVFSSTYDRAKCYIDLPKPKRDKFTVDLFCLTTFNYDITASQLVWNALAVNAIANTIINAAIELRIWCVTPLQIEKNNNMFLLTRMKDYQESLDTNAIAIACADPRFYRLHTFRARSYAVDEIGDPNLMDSGMGYSITDIAYAKDSILELFEREQMWDDEQNQLVYKENKIFLNVCLSENQGKTEFRRVIDYFEMFAEWKQMGQSATIEKFERWYKGKLRNTMPFSEYLEKYP